MVKDLKIREELFVKEELDRIEELIRIGETSKLMNVLDEITPAKEIEIQRILNAMENYTEDFESEVRERMKKECPMGPQSPEEEAFWEKELQQEFKKHVENIKKGKESLVENKSEKIEGEDNSSNPDTNVRTIEDVRNELVEVITAIKAEKKAQKPDQEKITQLKEKISALQDEEESLSK